MDGSNSILTLNNKSNQEILMMQTNVCTGATDGVS